MILHNRFTEPRRSRALKTRFRAGLATALSVLLLGGTLFSAGLTAAPAQAEEPAQAESALQVIKKVDDADEKLGMAPGEGFSYTIQISCENYDCLNPSMTDILPAELAGFTLIGLSASHGKIPADKVSLTLGGKPFAGKAPISADAEERTIRLSVFEDLRDTEGTGMNSDNQVTVTVDIAVPNRDQLSPDWEFNGAEILNTANYDAENAEDPVDDSALISVVVPRVADVVPGKTWNPGTQVWKEGEPSTVTVSGKNGSNVRANTLVVQDPVAAADGAAQLDETNPFRYVDFAGLGASTLPAGATTVQVDAYVFDGTVWAWQAGTPAATAAMPAGVDNAQVGGLRFTYAGADDTASLNAADTATASSQAFTVTQRATDRLEASVQLKTGFTAKNTISATVTAPGLDPVTKEADATLTVGKAPIDINVSKQITQVDGSALPAKGLPVGSPFRVTLGAENKPAPHSSSLDSLTITESKPGTSFLSADLAFAGFEADSHVWPTEATGATLTWMLGDETQQVTLQPGDALPAAPAGKTVTGFEITYTGEIAPGAKTGLSYRVESNPEMAIKNADNGDVFKNVIQATGERDGSDPVTKPAEADVRLYPLKIDINIDKKIGPGTVVPGQSVMVELNTTVNSNGPALKPEQITVTDVWDGKTDPRTFWDAFRLTEIVQVNIPEAATLEVRLARLVDGEIVWESLAAGLTGSYSNGALPNPDGIVGVEFIYTQTGPEGLPAGTRVKPNLMFKPATTFRDGTTPVLAEGETEIQRFENVAVAKTHGTVGETTVKAKDDDNANVGIRPLPTGEGTGGLFAGKRWVEQDLKQDLNWLPSQADAPAWSVQNWAASQPGIRKIEVIDPSNVEKTGVAGTVFNTFDLRKVLPITLAQDPQLAWDSVIGVELYNGSAWVPVQPVGGSWMTDKGFVGYTLSDAEIASTLGVKLVYVPNDDARPDADGEPLTAPRKGTGITASGIDRPVYLEWQLRNSVRDAEATTNPWVQGSGNYNCAPNEGETVASPGCVENAFTVVGTTDNGTVSNGGSDTLQILDGVLNVGVEKKANPAGPLLVPVPGDALQADYPTTRYTITGWNASQAEHPSSGKVKTGSKIGYLRVTDTAPKDRTEPTDWKAKSAFAGAEYDAENNHFEVFNLTKISFDDLPNVDKNASQVALWKQDGTVTELSITEAEALAPEALLDVVGVSTVYQSTDPEANGAAIAVGVPYRMHLDAQLRDSFRSATDTPVTASATALKNGVNNTVLAQGYEPNVHPKETPWNDADVAVTLEDAKIDIHLRKQITVDNGLTGAANENVINEANPNVPVHVQLTADDKNSTVSSKTVTIEDTSAAFWKRFTFVGFDAGKVALPKGADRIKIEIHEGDSWVEIPDFSVSIADAIARVQTKDIADINGVRVTYKRDDGRLFSPANFEHWSASLGFTVKLRPGQEFPVGEAVNNTATAVGTHPNLKDVDSSAKDDVTFSEGTLKLKVIKRAPNDVDGGHIVEPLDSNEWVLRFENTGTGYLPITEVVDSLPKSLIWDGEEPTFEAFDSGLGTDVSTELVPGADGASELRFTWPQDTPRMNPGSAFEIRLGLILGTGLKTGEKAVNTVVVHTGKPVQSCENPNDFGQVPVTGLSDTECGNTNYVQPKQGGILAASKTVKGEVVDTLGEDLVSGAVNYGKPAAECTVRYGENGDYTRFPCAANTAVGATDAWNITTTNVGTTNMTQVTVVDTLPMSGDRMLAGKGSARNSNFRPVLQDLAQLGVHNLTDGATQVVEVTTSDAACVNPNADQKNLWENNPRCLDTPWTAVADYTGTLADITAFRVTVDYAGGAFFKPGDELKIDFNTINQVDATDNSVRYDLAAPRQIAWNQAGVSGIQQSGVPSNAKAPKHAGVTVQTGQIELFKELKGEAANAYAPTEFPVQLVCDVPSGLTGEGQPERVEMNLGDSALVMVPGNKPGTADEDRKSVVIDRLPIGADCYVTEADELGTHGEVERELSGTVVERDGAEWTKLQVRLPQGPESDTPSAQVATLTNSYAFGELTVDKALLSIDSEHELQAEQLTGTFGFELVCLTPRGPATEENPGGSIEIRENFELTLPGDASRTFSEIPVGSACTLTETETGKAVDTTFLVNSEAVAPVGEEAAAAALADTEAPTEGEGEGEEVAPQQPSIDQVMITEGKTLVDVTNWLTPIIPEDPDTDGPDVDGPGVDGTDTDTPDVDGTDVTEPKTENKLSVTGSDISGLVIAALALLGLGAGAVVIARRKRQQS